MYNKLRRYYGQLNQDGIASIIIVIILVTLLTLISIGFARLMNRTVNNSLNNQLSSSANYAAQSAINDTITYLQKNPGVSSNNCSGSGSILGTGSGQINPNFAGDPNEEYSCILVNNTPSDLFYQKLDVGGSQVVKMTTNPSHVDTLQIGWSSADGHTSFPPSGTSLSSETSWNSQNYAPMLRVTLYPIASDSANYDPNALAAASHTYFLYPNNGGAAKTISYATADGSIVTTPCSTSGGTYNCNLTINNLQAAAGNPEYYYLRLTALYDAASVDIKGSASGTGVQFINVQSIIDVSAKASSATKRLRARVEINNYGNVAASSSDVPDYSLRSAETICKRLQVTPSGPITIDGIVCTNQANINNPTPTATLTATPTSITAGGSSTLSWSSTNSSSCSATSPAGWTNSTATSGSKSVSPGSTTAYTITCTGAGGGSANANATVTVTSGGSGGGGSGGGGGGTMVCSVYSGGWSDSQDAYAYGGCTNSHSGGYFTNSAYCYLITGATWWSTSGSGNTVHVPTNPISPTGGGCSATFTVQDWNLDCPSPPSPCASASKNFTEVFSVAPPPTTCSNGATNPPECNYFPPPPPPPPPPTQTCTYGGSISVPPGCSGCWDGSTATSYSQCPTKPICKTNCGPVFNNRPPDNLLLHYAFLFNSLWPLGVL